MKGVAYKCNDILITHITVLTRYLEAGSYIYIRTVLVR